MFAVTDLLYVAAALFSIGAYGVLSCRSVLVVLMAIEIMLASVSLSMVVFSQILMDSAGQVFVIFNMAVAAGEAAVGLAIFLAFYRQTHSTDTDTADVMKG